MTKSIAKIIFACVAAIALTCTSAQAKNTTISITNLVSDMTGVAQIVDTNLVDPWGFSSGTFITLSLTDFTTNVITNYDLTTNFVVKSKHKTNIVVTTNFLSFTVTTNVLADRITNSFFWLAANQTDKALVYAVTNDALGNPQVVKQGLEVNFSNSFPAGLVVNSFPFFGTNTFTTNNFFFASEDGTISSWASGDTSGAAVVLTNGPTTNTVYKAIAEVFTTANGPVLFAANFSEGTLDEYGTTNFTLMNRFTDPKMPPGYAPFNVQLVDGVLFVTFAKQDVNMIDDVAGQGNGVIDIFNPDVEKFYRFATGTGAGGKEKLLNSPYGLALAPASWGKYADRLLVANFGDGTITVFGDNGSSKGQVLGNDNLPIMIEGIWGLNFGTQGVGDTDYLYFTAGPGGEAHGIFGALIPPPSKKKTK